MIAGIGTDVVNIGRIDALFKRYGDRFVNRVLSPYEIKQFTSNNSILYLARRFAGKEALSKAMGTGIGRPLRFNDITIYNNDLGMPEVRIEDVSKADLLKKYNMIHISLSDDFPVAVAFVIIS